MKPLSPGQYVEEIPSLFHTITAAPTSVTVFLGYPDPSRTQTFGQPVPVSSFADYERGFGGFFNDSRFDADIAQNLFADLAMAVYQFFQNGGKAAYVVGLTPESPAGSNQVFSENDFIQAMRAGSALDQLAGLNLLVIPGVTSPAVLAAAAAFCPAKRAFLIMDPPPGVTPDGAGGTVSILDSPGYRALPQSQNAALYFPWLQSTYPPTGAAYAIPPSATVAGIYAATDQNRGVWKGPAGLTTRLVNVIDVVPSGRMTDQCQAVLDRQGINCLRTFPGFGPVVFGARTSGAANPAFAEWQYVPVRRLALFLEQTLYANLGWVVFEPNAEPLWAAIRSSLETFLHGLFRQGAFQGATPSQAFLVKCDNETTTQNDVNNGIVNIVVGFAPLKPAEFVILQISQTGGQTRTA